ncbi:thyrostimulin beta-5 subunit-like [Achroia grisella]|uniref:thyrostimulin beta-5 subunit-like n=1 Tax=Achroia grisella TaxID=688607 RepID=UPI0027D2890A|nr:thyrostimulin beta-5 subunit-like [Achroia grisella]
MVQFCKPINWLLFTVTLWTLDAVLPMETCTKRVSLARAEQTDDKGRRCWDRVKVHSCGGRCDSREISDWEFPFKKSHHPVCVYGTRRPVMVRLRNCDADVVPGTENFHYIAADDCRCKVCSSHHTSCEWLPPNSTLLQGINDNLHDDDNDYDI